MKFKVNTKYSMYHHVPIAANGLELFLESSLWNSCPFLLACWTKRIKLDPCYQLLKIHWKASMKKSEKSGRTLRGFEPSRKGKKSMQFVKNTISSAF